jgi:AraC-like DNA-binding protein
LKTIFSTQGVHPRDRFDYWHQIACKSVVDHDSRPESRLNFTAELEAERLAGLDLIVFQNSPMDVSHEVRHIVRAKDDDIFVCRQIAGALRLEQEGRELTLEPGQFALLDSALPYIGRFFSGSKLLVIKVPRHEFEARLGPIQSLVARGISPEAGTHGLTSSLLALLPAHVSCLAPLADQAIKTQILDLIAFGLAQYAGRVQLSSSKALSLLRLRAVIESRLMDPDLTPAQAAAAAGMSTRYANALLAKEGQSLARFIQARRLARCRKALEDPLQQRRTVSEIAFAWGFSDMTHFGRSFKKTFGILPSELKRQAEKRGAMVSQMDRLNVRRKPLSLKG